MKKRVSFHTLGCRLNQSETDVLMRRFEQLGYQVVAENQTADVCVINTCTVTEHSDAKNRQAIRTLNRQNPEASIAVIGCYAQMSADAIAEIEGVKLVIGSEEKMKMTDYLQQMETATEPLIILPKIQKKTFKAPIVPFFQMDASPELNEKSECETAFSSMHGSDLVHTRASLKIQDGCDFMCSFCIIPFARGRSRYRDFENILEEARMRVDEGIKEIVLTGVNVGTFQQGKTNIVKVIDQLNDLPGLERIRISSIEPTTVPVQLFQFMSDPNHKLVPFFHLPLQSGSNSILQKMKRKHSAEQYADEILQAHDSVPDLCIGTDVMVGFPGESEQEFDETLQLLKQLPVSYFHVFPFSARAGTPAHKMEGQIEPGIKQTRSSVLRQLSHQKRIAFHQQFLGKTRKILWESRKEDGSVHGYTDNYIRVVMNEESSLKTKDYKNQILKTRLDSMAGQWVRGTIV